ncbi:MAG TPA: ElyC/SanA/YdcF family protein [Brumimicrobium sp.]|nr:ElyC/SanA/YdcF family protein [Brumimicrobium sp.]
MKKAPKKRRRLLLIIPILGFILPFALAYFSNAIIISNSQGKTFNTVKEMPHNRVGVLLGTSKYYVKGGINLYFKYRVEAAARLYKSGKIDYILVSGDNSTLSYNEPREMRKELIKLGVPEDKIVLDFAGFRTLDSVVRASKVFRQNKYTVISQRFHNERAIYLAQKYGLDVVGYNAKDVDKNQGVKTKIREYFARTKAILDVLFHVKPKFLGEEIDI